MASLRHETNGNRKGWRLAFRQGGKRRSLWVGAVSKRKAQEFERHVGELALAADTNCRPAPASLTWAAGLDGRRRATLEQWGLIAPVSGLAKSDAGRLLGPFLQHYIDDRTDLGDGTLRNYSNARDRLVDHFGDDRTLASITPADAARWRRWLLARPVKRDADGNAVATMATATVSKLIKRAKTMFDAAVDDRLLTESPFAKEKSGSEANPDRHYFVDRHTSQRVLDACPDAHWRMIFALARFGGLRCPSEVTVMTWGDVDWENNRLRIDSPKTGLRECSLFPELRPIMEAAFEAAPEGQVYCVGPHHGVDNLRTMMTRIIRRAGIEPWAKPFINLRSTRRTELQEAFPSHVVDAWLGHSSETARKHYLQVTPDHWTAGAEKVTGDHRVVGGDTGGVIPAGSASLTPNHQNGKTPETRGFERSRRSPEGRQNGRTYPTRTRT